MIRAATRPLKLAEQIAADLTRALHVGEIEPGARLPTEAALGRRYEVSRGVVREAMSMLRSNGVIESRRGSGSFVLDEPRVALAHKLPSPTLDSVIAIFELRRALETSAAGLAAVRASRAQRSRIRNAVTEIDEAVDAGESGVTQDLAFHRAIAEAANNDYFVMALDFYSRFLFRAISVSRINEARQPSLMHEVVSEHAAIVDAIMAGDTKAAEAATASHMENGMRRLREVPAPLRESLEAEPGGDPWAASNRPPGTMKES